MKVARWYNNQDIRLEDVPRPRPGAGEILVKVMACGICGSDVVEWYRLPRAPLVQGHEIGGEIVAVGESVKGYRPGDRVFVAPKVPCMRCRYCKSGHPPVCVAIKERLPGGLAEFVLVPKPLVAKGTYLLPESVSYDRSTFIEPLACVVRAQNAAGVSKGRSVLVMGCGMSGLLHVKLALAKGCRVIATDIREERLAFAQRLGAHLTIDAGEDVAERLVAGNGAKAEVVLLCTSALRAVEQAWQCVDRGGAVVFFAVPGPDKEVKIPINDFWTQEIKILTTYYCGPADILDALELIATGGIEVDDLITHRFPLQNTAEGFQRVIAGRESIKVIIRPND